MVHVSEKNVGLLIDDHTANKYVGRSICNSLKGHQRLRHPHFSFHSYELLSSNIFFSATPLLSSSSFNGCKITVDGMGGIGKLNLQIAFPFFLQVLACLCV